MILVVKSIFLICLYFVFYYLLGYTFTKITKGKTASSEVLLKGMFCYAILFFLLAFPMKWNKMSVTLIARSWLGIISILSIVILIVLRKQMKSDLKHSLNVIKEHKFKSGLVLLTVAGELILELMEKYPGSPADAASIIGEVTQSLFHDVSGMYEPVGGMLLPKFDARYFPETYTVHSAVMCKLFKFPAVVESRTVMQVVIIILFSILIWQLGKIWFKDSFFQKYMLLIGIFVVYNFSDSRYWPGYFFTFRTYEGKTIMASIFMPFIMLTLIRIYRYNRKEDWISLFIATFACFMYCMSAIYILPVFLGVYLLMLVIAKRKWSYFWKSALCLLPCVAALVYYLLAQLEIINLTI